MHAAKKLCIQKYEEYYALLFLGFLLVFVFLLMGGMLLISRITKPISEFSDALDRVTLHKKQKPQHIQLEENVPREISTMVSGYNDLVSVLKRILFWHTRTEISQKKDRAANAAIPDQSSFFYITH